MDKLANPEVQSLMVYAAEGANAGNYLISQVQVMISSFKKQKIEREHWLY